MQSIELKMEKQDFRTKEAFKTLRTNIEFSGENIRVICVTSCTACPMSLPNPLHRMERKQSSLTPICVRVS